MKDKLKFTAAVAGGVVVACLFAALAFSVGNAIVRAGYEITRYFNLDVLSIILFLCLAIISIPIGKLAFDLIREAFDI